MSRRPKTPPPNWTPPPGQWPPPGGWQPNDSARAARGGNWFARHKGTSVAGGFFVVLVVVVGVAHGGAKPSPASTAGSPPAAAIQDSTNPSPTTSADSAAQQTAPATANAAAASVSVSATASRDQAVPTTTSLSAASADELAELSTLAVKGRAPMTGYSRDQFGPAWPTIDGCDERNDTLHRDLTAITMRDSCVVAIGTLVSPYDGTTINFVRGPDSALVQIDHVVALGDAWQTGAQYWNSTTRESFANDPIELLAVDAHSNEQKGDSDAASWLPANKAFRCAYVGLQVDVKSKYHLWVTQAEHDAIASILAKCSGVGVQSPTTTARPTSAPTKPDGATSPDPTPTPTTAAPVPTHSYVTPGAFCSTAGATGVSKTGKPEVCKTSATDSRLRWRAA